jgi:uncharacterized protein (DUF952 family)
MPGQVLYKVLLPDELKELHDNGSFFGSPFEISDGFIHLCTAEQLPRVLRDYFSPGDRAIIATLKLEALGEAVAWEPSNSGELYPHLYGPLSLGAVLSCAAAERDTSRVISSPHSAY